MFFPESREEQEGAVITSVSHWYSVTGASAIGALGGGALLVRDGVARRLALC